MRHTAIHNLASRLRKGDRSALSKAITLVESEHDDHQDKSETLFRHLAATGLRHSVRIGITGATGVGKSTFINTLGTILIGHGHRVAVLAVDPTSTLAGGSILGDKTRMSELTRHEACYIRPSPSGRNTDGVGDRTGEAALLCEQACYDFVIIETTGTGQTNVLVSEIADIFLLLVAPHGGDELQGIKRGVMELADFVLVTKNDGEHAATAGRTCAEYASALRLLRHRRGDPDQVPNAMTVSSLCADTVMSCWQSVEELIAWRRDHGTLLERRQRNSAKRLESEIRLQILNRIRNDAALATRLEDLAHEVARSGTSPMAAAREILDALSSCRDIQP
ncbi:MAG: methylmalonyl Co-A mutase-associated GTPase MeaB [Rhodobacteraceae bacterium]|nr:methylmalonyl Co-A mutase-associated GTPase MeaB [Paracoccaceae bacterium]